MNQHNQNEPRATGGGSQRDEKVPGKKGLEFDRTDIKRTDSRQAEMGGKGLEDEKGRIQGLPYKDDNDTRGGQGHMGATRGQNLGLPTDDADAHRVARGGTQGDSTPGPRGIDGAVGEGVENASEPGTGSSNPNNPDKAW